MEADSAFEKLPIRITRSRPSRTARRGDGSGSNSAKIRHQCQSGTAIACHRQCASARVPALSSSPAGPPQRPVGTGERSVATRIRFARASVVTPSPRVSMSGSAPLVFFGESLRRMGCLPVVLDSQVKPMLFDFVRSGPMKHPNVPVRPAPGLMNGSIDHSRHVVHSALQVVRLSLRCGQATSSELFARGMHRVVHRRVC